jgi:hypothetical protein
MQAVCLDSESRHRLTRPRASEVGPYRTCRAKLTMSVDRGKGTETIPCVPRQP